MLRGQAQALDGWPSAALLFGCSTTVLACWRPKVAALAVFAENSELSCPRHPSGQHVILPNFCQIYGVIRLYGPLRDTHHCRASRTGGFVLRFVRTFLAFAVSESRTGKIAQPRGLAREARRRMQCTPARDGLLVRAFGVERAERDSPAKPELPSRTRRSNGRGKGRSRPPGLAVATRLARVSAPCSGRRPSAHLWQFCGGGTLKSQQTSTSRLSRGGELQV